MKRLLGFVLTLTLSLSSFPAHADDKVKQAARARYLEGVAQVKRSDWEGGYLSFKQAYSVIQLPDVLYNLSVCELKTHRTLDALGHFRAFLADPSISAKDRTLAQGHVVILEAETGRLRPKVGAGAEVTIDGKRVDYRAGAPAIDVTVGKHELAVVYPDGAVKKTSVEVKAGETAEPELQPAPVPVASATTASTATTAPGASTKPPIDHPPPPQPNNTAKWAVSGTLVGVGVVSLVGGLVFGAVSRSKNADAVALGAQGACSNPGSTSCEQLEGLRSSQNGASTMAMVGYVAAPILVGAGLVSYFIWPTSKSTPALAPVVLPGGIGVLVGGKF